MDIIIDELVIEVIRVFNIPTNVVDSSILGSFSIGYIIFSFHFLWKQTKGEIIIIIITMAAADQGFGS